MAGDWIGELAEAARAHDEQHLMREHRRAQEAEVVAAKCQCFWATLVATVEQDILRFQHEFAHDSNRSLALEKPEGKPYGFRVFRPAGSGLSLDVWLHPASRAIEFKYHTIAVDRHAASDWSGTLTIRVDTGGELYLSQYGRDFLNFDEISRMFLERVFKGAFR
jgi:hypothetical protein